MWGRDSHRGKNQGFTEEAAFRSFHSFCVNASSLRKIFFFFFFTVDGIIILASFIYCSTLTQGTFLPGTLFIVKGKCMLEVVWGWDFQKLLWFLLVAFRWTLVSQEETKLDVSSQKGPVKVAVWAPPRTLLESWSSEDASETHVALSSLASSCLMILKQLDYVCFRHKKKCSLLVRRSQSLFDIIEWLYLCLLGVATKDKIAYKEVLE